MTKIPPRGRLQGALSDEQLPYPDAPVLTPGTKLEMAPAVSKSAAIPADKIYDWQPPPSVQVAGTHYAIMGIDPSRFAMANDYDADAFSILKYLSRHRRKDGREGIEKAISFITIRLRNFEFITFPRRHLISVETYIQVNNFDHATSLAIHDLHAWHYGAGGDNQQCENLRMSLGRILSTYR